MASQSWNQRPNRSSKQWISKKKRQAIYERDGYTCVYCHQSFPVYYTGTYYEVILTLDHLTPRAEGGCHEPHNLVTSCSSCNSRRQAVPWWSFADEQAREYIYRVVLKIPKQKERIKVVV